jgi:hypothetical protein
VTDDPQAETPKPTEFFDMDVKHLNGTHYRSIHVDGALGGFNQFGEFYMALFSERPANPEQIRVRVFATGEQHPIGQKGFAGMEREIEIGIYMQPAIAEQFARWILTKLRQYKDLEVESHITAELLPESEQE